MNYSVFFFLLLVPVIAIAQPDPRDAKEHFHRGNYPAAIKSFQQLLKSDPANVEYNLNTGICYLKLNVDKTKAIPYLEKAVEGQAGPEATFYLAQAYHHAHRFDEAEKMFNEYLAKTGGNDALGAKRQLEYCTNAKELTRNPLNVEFTNLGENINTTFPDYYPIVPPDGSFIVFTTRRKGGVAMMEFDGFFSSDVYMAHADKEGFTSAKSVGPAINTSYDEQAVGLSADGEQLFVYIDHLKEYGDIYLSERTTKSFGRRVKLGESVNSKEFETSGTISLDGNIMFFASRREGGVGGTDLYMTRKIPGGDWALPQNLGSNINTYLNEDFPYLLPDGKTLYFASQGHNSMGGYDIFTSVWDEESNSWSAPRNIGFPLNSPADDMTIYFTADGRTGYLSTYRPDGFGDLDIYRVTFTDVEARKTIIRANVLSLDTLAGSIPAMITVTDPQTEDLIGSYLPNPRSGEFIIILPPGSYALQVESEGHKMVTEKLVLFDHAGYLPELSKTYKLIPE